jgi:putative transposase
MTVALLRRAAPPRRRRHPVPMKERLSRLAAIYRENPIFFITFCTRTRQKLLANDSIHARFQIFCRHAAEAHILVDHYVIMPDHIHLFVHMTQVEALPGWIKSLKNSLSKELRAAGIDAPHWQKGYFDHILRSESSYEEKWAYVRMNPVRQKLVLAPEDWKFQGQVVPLRKGKG